MFTFSHWQGNYLLIQGNLHIPALFEYFLVRLMKISCPVPAISYVWSLPVHTFLVWLQLALVGSNLWSIQISSYIHWHALTSEKTSQGSNSYKEKETYCKARQYTFRKVNSKKGSIVLCKDFIYSRILSQKMNYWELCRFFIMFFS